MVGEVLGPPKKGLIPIEVKSIQFDETWISGRKERALVFLDDVDL
jgi:hypothetical protein